MSTGEPSAKGRARWVVVAAVAVTATLYFVPYGIYLAYPMLLLSTYAHEMGHGLAALLAGGELRALHLYADGSGLAEASVVGGRWVSAFIAAGGLIGPPMVAAGFFAATARARLARWTLMLFAVAMLLSCLWVVRGLFAWIFVGGMGLVCLAVARRGGPVLVQGAVALLATQLALSVFSRADYLFTEVAVVGGGAARPSDVGQIAAALLLPYWLWGGLIALFSGAVLAAGLWIFWRATRQGPAD